MTEEVQEPVVAEEVKTEPVVEAPRPLLRRVIQPKDEQGNPIGAVQVFTGATEQELIDKLADAQMHASRRIIQLKMERFPKKEEPKQEVAAEPKPRVLSADELFELQNKTPVEQFREIYKAETGRSPEEDLRFRLKAEKDAEEARKNSVISATRAAAKAFMEESPEYYSSPRNGKIIGEYMASMSLPTTDIDSYRTAFKDLATDGLLELEPVKEPEPEIPVRAQEPVREPEPEIPVKEPAVQKVAKTAFPSAITRDQASGTGAVKPKKPSAADISMMNSAQYRAYLESQGQWGK